MFITDLITPIMNDIAKTFAVMVFVIATHVCNIYAQDYGPFEIPNGTEDNPLLDVKYKVELEPFIFEPEERHELSFRTYISYTATFADGTTKTGRDWIYNFIGGNVSGYTQWSTQARIKDPEWSKWQQNEDTWYINSLGGEFLVDLSSNWFWNADSFIKLKNINQLAQPFILPSFYHNQYGEDYAGYTEWEAPWLETEYYEFYTGYAGYGLFVELGICGADYQFTLFQPIVRIKDSGVSIATCNVLDPGEFKINFENLGSQYGYMETIKITVLEELVFNNIHYSYTSEELVHFTYPTSEEIKQYARDAGYDVP